MADLTMANFEGADLRSAKLTESNIARAIFLEARNLETADFTGARGMATAIFPPSYELDISILTQKIAGYIP